MPAVREHTAVSKRALVQRINRHLQKQRKALKAMRRGRAREATGEYYVVNDSHQLVQSHVYLQDLGRELGVLKPYERLEED